MSSCHFVSRTWKSHPQVRLVKYGFRLWSLPSILTLWRTAEVRIIADDQGKRREGRDHDAKREHHAVTIIGLPASELRVISSINRRVTTQSGAELRAETSVRTQSQSRDKWCVSGWAPGLKKANCVREIVAHIAGYPDHTHPKTRKIIRIRPTDWQPDLKRDCEHPLTIGPESDIKFSRERAYHDRTDIGGIFKIR